jgi:hypothetical protein
MNITAKPTWQWSGKNIPAPSSGARTGGAGTSALKHTSPNKSTESVQPSAASTDIPTIALAPFWPNALLSGT